MQCESTAPLRAFAVARGLLDGRAMPSLAHELPLALLRESPGLVLSLVRSISNVTLPRHHEVRVEDSDLSQIVPVDLRADLVLTARDRRGRLVAAFIIESQLRPDRIKLFTWPLYAMAERARIRCPVYVLVLTRSRAVARWAARPIPIGPDGAVFRCLVVGPDSIPRIRSPKRARKHPELAVLSAIFHAEEPDALALARTALVATRSLDRERRSYYYELLWEALGEAARVELERAMIPENFEFKSPYARRVMADIRKRREEAIAEGMARGLAEGKVAAKAADILAVLQARHIRIGKRMRERIFACRDIPTLDRWLTRAAVVRTASEIFAGE